MGSNTNPKNNLNSANTLWTTKTLDVTNTSETAHISDAKKVYELFPEILPYKTHNLKVSTLHTLYVEEVGNPDGYPVLFLHGGPGGGINETHRRFFNPNFYQIILFDQRGAGKSTPHAELRENTTWDLVEDIEKIRRHLGVSKWLVFGGSWGSTLALAYSTTYPQTVSGLVLRGIFLCRPSEIHWFYQDGASQIFSDFFQTYSEYIPLAERDDYVKAYYKRLTGENKDEQVKAARIWSKWEAATSKLIVDQTSIDEYESPEKALSFARIECHYFINNAFFRTPNYLLEQVHKIRHIPTVIVQGRYDVVCPMRSAWDLHRTFPESKLVVVAEAGHSANEVGIRSALVEACENFTELLMES